MSIFVTIGKGEQKITAKLQENESQFGVFWRALPLKISLFWRQKRLLKHLSVGQPKIVFLKYQRGTLWVGMRSNP